MKHVYLMRHCQTKGQDASCRLTEKGSAQAIELAHFFKGIRIERIISSPYQRALESCRPIAQDKQMIVEEDIRLAERVLSNVDLPNWQQLLEESFQDLEKKLEGGESGAEAAARGLEVLEEAISGTCDHIAIMTHGNLLTLMLQQLNPTYGFLEWKRMTNPDVFHLMIDNGQCQIERIWDK